MSDNSGEDKVTYEKIVFDTDEGKEELYVLEQTKLAGVNYILVTDDVDSEEGSFLILKEDMNSEGDFASYDIVEDENELKSVISLFDEMLDDFDLEV
ncbi:MAG: DUF1292 domain-containing protein [Wujia sp.]